MSYRASQAHARREPIQLLCRPRAVAALGNDAWRSRPERARSVSARAARSALRVIHRASRETYGSPSVWDALVKEGHRIGEHRVARLMRQDGIRTTTVKTWRATTPSHHRCPLATHTLNRPFTVTSPNRVWAGDLPSVWTTEGWLSLAVSLDLYSRLVLGWAMGHRLTMALANRSPRAGIRHHSDRGSPYAATDDQRLLGTHGIITSMSRTGNGGDNACVESIFGTLTRERVYPQHDATRDEARPDTFESIELFDNRKRRHSTLG